MQTTLCNMIDSNSLKCGESTMITPTESYRLRHKSIYNKMSSAYTHHINKAFSATAQDLSLLESKHCCFTCVIGFRIRASFYAWCQFAQQSKEEEEGNVGSFVSLFLLILPSSLGLVPVLCWPWLFSAAFLLVAPTEMQFFCINNQKLIYACNYF